MESRRCLLRRFILEDLAWLTDLIGDPEVNCFLGEKISSQDHARREAEAMIIVNPCCQFGLWAIQDKETATIHGWTGLGKLRPWRGPSDEIAVSFVLRRASWGQGLATEVAGSLVRRAFEDRWLDRIMAVTAVGNTASKRVLEKIGMRAVASPDPRGREFHYFRIDAPFAMARNRLTQ